jgi:TonB family protein
MSRLQKKCFLASAGFHLLLALILIVGPAFLSPNSKTDNLPILDFVPVKTVDALVSGGGNPRALPPPAVTQPTPQPPTPAPPAVSPPEPAQATEPAPEKTEPAPTRRHTVEVNTKLVRRDPTETAEARTSAQRRSQEEARRQAAASALTRTAAGIQSGLSGSTTVELKGPGGGGVPYANFLSAVRTVYMNAWIVPQGVTDDSTVVKAEVMIRKDGTVASSRITDRSGNMVVDQSVEDVLRRVRFVAPLPEDADEPERPVKIAFDVKAKLLG